jgi:hypothetical protein
MTDVHPNLPAPVLCALLGLEPERCVCWVGSLEERDKVFDLARSLVGHHACEVVMCLDPGEAGPRKRPLTPEVIIAAEIRLQRLYEPDTRTMVLPGHPISEIRRFARTQQIDLIVMGEQAHAIEQKFGERLIDDAPCAVLSLIHPRGPSVHLPAHEEPRRTSP